MVDSVSADFATLHEDAHVEGDKFLMTNYVPMWFACKQHIRITEGPKHLYKQTQLTKFLQEPVLTIARGNISKNAYWAHPEVLLLAMLADQKETICSKAVDKILSLRGGSDHGDDQPRLYEVPVLKFNAKSYTEMIDWKRETIYEIHPIPSLWKDL